ncbi:hypothetical protein ACSBR2_033414 [Camellia fascicularis]
MQSKSESVNQIEANPYNILPSAACSEPWWRSRNYNYISPTMIGGNTSNSSSVEQSKDGESQSDDGLDEEDDAIKESQITSPHSDGNYAQGHQNFQNRTSAIPPMINESLTQPHQLEPVGHSIACASNPYLDPYYAGMMATYGPQPWVPPHLLDMHHARMPLPLEMVEEPVYVNAKQYHGILRRRESRAKAELARKLIKVRKPYLHESRHMHAIRRVRGSGGRFVKKSDAEASKCTAEETGIGSASATSSHSASSSGSEPLRCEAAETQDSHQEEKGSVGHGTCEARGYANDGDSSIQQCGSISSKKASQRSLAM